VSNGFDDAGHNQVFSSPISSTLHYAATSEISNDFPPNSVFALWDNKGLKWAETQFLIPP
jgi:hypothetical protein